MTAIAMVRGNDGVAIATDAATYELDGRLQHLMSKVALIPERNCVISARGAAGLTGRLAEAVRHQTFDFDDVLALLGWEAKKLLDEWREWIKPRTEPKHIDLHIAGWSSARERYETYILCSGEKIQTDVNGVLMPLAPWSLTPVPSMFASPLPDAEVARRFGLDYDKFSNGYDAAARIVCAVRSESRAFHEGAAAMGCIAGGWLQMTILKRDFVSTEIIHRWPDVIGEPIDPTRGEPLPKFLRLDDEGESQ